MEYEQQKLPTGADLAKQLDFHQVVAAMNAYPTLLRRLANIAAATAPSDPRTPAPPARPATSSTKPPRVSGNGASASPSPTASGELPIPCYDQLSATQVIERLEGLAQPELLAVKTYELAHRARTTILGKIAQLVP